MADSNPSTDASRNGAHTAANGEGSSNSTNSRFRDQRGGRNEGRGGRGGRGGGGRGRGQGRGKGKGFGGNDRGGRHKKADMGRGEYGRENIDRRKRNDDSQAKRLKNEENGEGASNSLFTKEEIEAEDRKPKRKVAVMIGYAGTGYKGMQINALEKTIEGDLFDAFVKAGAISKANADDPKKSSLVRCARTDKGVHAAGNVISLKLIVEDPNIVQAINEHLPPQIRVWGMERTNGSFSCYQTCDSRWYEYLIPTFALLPPHPQSYLGMKLLESADKEDVLETWKAGQADAASFWDDTEEKYIKPILDKLEPELRTSVLAVINSTVGPPNKAAAGDNIQTRDGTSKRKRDAGEEADDSGAKKIKAQPNDTEEVDDTRPNNIMEEPGEEEKLSEPQPETSIMKVEGVEAPEETASSKSVLTPLDVAVKEVKAAYIAAKKAYRISDQRRSRVQETLDAYLGTRNFHNYTIQKRFSDPSAKRVIRSFNVGKDPVIINDTEWLSLKVHGQSFMMHQIRKMIAMAAMVVRCGTPLSIIQESYGPSTISIPKAPGLGLLLERPVFETYNERASKEFSREKIDFDKYKTEMEAFKQREIYDRIFREEERDHQFHSFFHHIDQFRTDFFLWATASGMSAAKQSQARKEDGSDDEVDVNGEEG